MNRFYAVIGAGLAIAAALTLIVLALAPEAARLDIATEIAKASIGIFPAIFFGVIVAELLKQRDHERDLRERAQADRDARRERHQAARRAFRERAVATYSQSKGVRRRLRGGGFGPGRAGQITQAMLDVLDEQLGVLSDAQLGFEQLAREAETPDFPFAGAKAISGPLVRIEQYLNRVVNDWERGRHKIGPGADAGALERWTYFVDFVADKEGEHLPDNATDAFKELERIVLAELSAADAGT